MKTITAKIEFDASNKEVLNLLMKLQSFEGVRLSFENEQIEDDLFAKLLYELDKEENYLSESQSNEVLKQIGVL